MLKHVVKNTEGEKMDTQVQKVLPLIKERGQKNKSFSSNFEQSPILRFHISLFSPFIVKWISIVFIYCFLGSILSGCMSQHQQKRKLDLTSKLGVGFSQSLSSLKGASFQYGINNRFIFESMLGGYLSRNPIGTSDFKWGGSLGTLWQLLKIEDEAFIGLGLRYVYSNQRQCVKEGNACDVETPITLQTTTKALELPIRVAWYPHRVVSLHLDFGLSVSWENIESLLPDQAPQHWELFESTHQWGNFGLTVWF